MVYYCARTYSRNFLKDVTFNISKLNISQISHIAVTNFGTYTNLSAKFCAFYNKFVVATPHQNLNPHSLLGSLSHKLKL